MEQNIFLERNRSEFSNDVENAINVALSTKTRLLPNDNVSDNFSLFEQYNKERDECNKFRLVLSVNPICSNVLFNAKTEIVINEGSSACTSLYDGNVSLNKSEYAPKACNTKASIKYLDAIRNTEYSHKDNGGFVYHCGLNIFNNHMLRKKEFVHINKMNNETEKECGNVYNTMMDYCRDGRGNFVKMDLNVKYDNVNGEQTKMHLYQYDTIMPMNVAFLDNCIEKDGWWGFINPGTIEIGNNSGNTISINRMMANNKPCEFIDLYPDRSLFSFVPKFNKYRKRIEKNWDYCITYPYKADYDMINTVCGGELSAIKANIKLTINTSNQQIVECSSYFKHNLLPGNYVSFYYYLPHYKILDKTNEFLKVYENFAYLETDLDEFGVPKDGAKQYKEVLSKEFVRYSIKVKVQTVGDLNGDNKDRVFTVKYDDVKEIYDNMQNFGCFYKKNNGNTDCLYYFRKFKKIKSVIGDDIRSDVNKIAFAKNIYGDDIAQVVFTDDIDIDGLLDHNGRPVSDIFFTIVKRNAGYKEWYNRKNFSGDTVEFSHCFGKVTSGIDFCGIENEPFDFNIHYLHNISSTTIMTKAKYNTLSACGETILSGVPKTIENDITIDFDEFYGDIAEYDIYNGSETIIGNVYHRFNTAQRECWESEYMSILQDVIVSDDYDHANGLGKKWSAATYYVNNIKTSTDLYGDNKDSEYLMYGNISPEGYFYNPHIKIPVRKNNDDASVSPAKYVNYTKSSFERKRSYLLLKQDGTTSAYYPGETVKEDGDKVILQSEHYVVKIDSPVNYGFYKGDNIAFYNKKTMELNWGEITSISGAEITITFDGDSFSTIDNLTSNHFSPSSGERVLYAYWSPNNVPTYAKLSEGTRKFVWRTVIAPSEMTQNDELYDIPFTNGRFYLEKNINFFLKRQDPNGKYGLSKPMYVRYEQTVSNPMTKFNVKGHTPIDFSEIMYTLNNLTTNCY